MTYLCLALLLVLAGIFYLVNRNTGVQASDDPLSVGMVERWNAALPAVFQRVCGAYCRRQRLQLCEADL